MAHVKRTKGVSDVREVQDVLLAHLGLVDGFKRPVGSQGLDDKLAKHLGIARDALAEHVTKLHERMTRLRCDELMWQPWASDNQIIAMVQTLIDECALALGRERPAWTAWPAPWPAPC